MSEDKKNKFIFTDSFRTKDILWEAYAGFIDAYNNSKMLASIHRQDPIEIATMNKYAFYFYDEIQDFLDDFKEDIKDIESIKEIFEKSTIELDDYTKIRKFFATFMKISGIKNIVKEKDNPSNSVETNR